MTVSDTAAALDSGTSASGCLSASISLAAEAMTGIPITKSNRKVAMWRYCTLR